MAKRRTGEKRPGAAPPGLRRAGYQLRRAGLYKGLLFLGAVLLTAGLFLMTQRLVEEVRSSALSYLSRSVENYRILLTEGNPELAFEAMQGIDFPMVVTDSEGRIKAWRNLSVSQDDTSRAALEVARRFVRQARRQGNEPLAVEVFPGQVDYFHYGDPALVRLLQWMSVATAIAVALYVLVGYIGFRTIRKAEERSVWVGMARETAHQLGTPISSLMGWIEVLEARMEEGGGEAVASMRDDVRRLEKIAVRFGKIGAREALEPRDLDEVVEDAVRYMRTRVGRSITIEREGDPLGEAAVQGELIGWVLENLIRNAAQSMEGVGEITVRTERRARDIVVDVVDRGRGIAARDHETIFRPGYTTKNRGWGLGLSLARRIVEEMHGGRLHVLTSKPGEGSTLRMVLPA